MSTVYGLVAVIVGIVIALGLLRWLGKDSRTVDSEKRKELRRIEIEYGQNDSDPFNHHPHD